MIYFLSPKRSYELVYAIVFVVLALLALWKNPFRGQPRSALLLCATYAIAAIGVSAKFLYGHHGIDALWTGIFAAIGVGWRFWYRHDSKLGINSSSTGDTSIETNHG
jgi:hypothetical protein